jgi:hypothetical protein
VKFTEAVFNGKSQEIGINSGGAYYSLRELVCEEVAANGGATLVALALRNLANIVDGMELKEAAQVKAVGDGERP